MDPTPSFDWSTVNDAAQYHIQVDDSLTFSSLAIEVIIGNSEYTPSSGLSDGTYFWRVRAADSLNNWGAWSPVWSFTKDVVPPPPPPQGADAYEPDDTCNQAVTISTDGAVQSHTFHQTADEDWVSFIGQAGTEYLVEALTPVDSRADVALEVYDTCSGSPSDGQDYSFSPDVRLQFTVPSNSMYYLRLTNEDPSTAGDDVSYSLSVRALDDTGTPGALILVAGRMRENDIWQRNIHNVTNDVYQLFQGHGYSGDRIYYMATDLDIDVDKDGNRDVDELPSRQNLQTAIIQWAADKVSAARPLTLYMVDHGKYDYLYLDGISQYVGPEEIDNWLDALESAVPGLKVNIIIEACHSGSFIDLSETLSKPGRVVISSTGANTLAYASTDGATFSDAFVSALGRGMSLYGAFEEARGIATTSHLDQVPWLDDNGNGYPNQSTDGMEAQLRGFTYGGTLPGEQWPPYILEAEVGVIVDEEGVITAEVVDDKGIVSVWAVIYKPSYVPPDPNGQEMPQENLPTITLLDQDGDGVYSALYEGFDEVGAYRVVVYAVDVENINGNPKEVKLQNGWSLQLPIVIR
jgi:hypothetical protein